MLITFHDIQIKKDSSTESRNNVPMKNKVNEIKPRIASSLKIATRNIGGKCKILKIYKKSKLLSFIYRLLTFTTPLVTKLNTIVKTRRMNTRTATAIHVMSPSAIAQIHQHKHEFSINFLLFMEISFP